ncbi:MAG: sialate O-acetylesterase [Verrucomicrobiota bacterium]
MKKAVLTLLLSASSAFAAVKMPSVISDHMVLQSEKRVAIWGWADAGEAVTVEFAGQKQTTKADADGKWQIRLEPMQAGSAPQAMKVSGTNSITIQDVLVGEVWLASGQSNMAFKVGRGRDAEAEIAAAKFPQIRMYTVTRSAQPGPQADCGGEWVVCSPESVASFSAVAYFMGRELHEKLKRPVGLINSSVGGTDIAAWTSEEVQLPIPELNAFIEKWRQTDASFDVEKARQDYAQRMVRWKTAAEKATAGGRKAPRKPASPMQPRLTSNYPAYLFEGRIKPLIPYTLRGAVWYQGEHNCSTIEAGLLYRLQMPLLISDWRTRWAEEFPFAWVQLPGYTKSGPGRAFVREAQLQTLKVKNTGMVVTLDIGDNNDNHPKNKQDVGKRLATWALGRVYAQDMFDTSGPLFTGHEIRGSEVVAVFSHTEGGLTTRDGLRGFRIAGADKVLRPAQARIEDKKVVISSPDVPKPVAVRYAWESGPEATLFNGAGLPASPFRTDDWKE